MKTFFRFITFFILVFCFTAGTPAQAQNIHAIDVEKATNGAPRNNMFTTLDMFAELDGIFYFNADDGIHGRELWRSDGTAAGTWLVKDINIGIDPSNPDDIVVSGNKIFFAAADPVNGRELWTSDGTATGTHLVTDVAFGFQDAKPSYLTDVNGTLYFVTDVYYYNSRQQIWKTDGTGTGTVLVADFSNYLPAFGTNVRYLTNVNGKVFFTLDGFDSQLYVTDGTTSGTYQVKDINPFGMDDPSNLTAMNGALYFAAQDGYGVHLWVSDGTGAGTHAVNNSNNFLLPSYYYDNNERPFVVRTSTLFFQGSTPDIGVELCKYNASNPGNNVQLVKDIVPGNGGSNPNGLSNVNGTIFFSIYPEVADAELWKSNGAAAGTVQVKDINPGGTNYYYGLVGMNNTLIFAYANDALGFELWKSDGTATGTVLVKDILPGSYSSFPQFITYKHNTLIFGAYNNANGLELWKSDGTTAGTVLVKDINRTSSSSSNPYSFAASANNENNALFTAGTYKYGFELWASNGLDAGTKMIRDIYPGSGSSSPYHMINFKNKTYFFAWGQDGFYLGKTDGTAAGTSLFYQLNINGYVQDVAATNNLLYFTVFNYNTYSQELWRSNGTATGTRIVKNDILPYYQMYPVGVGNTLFFVNYDYQYGSELWKSDGSFAGTGIVKDIFPGFYDSNPFNLFNFNNKLYFAADYGYGPFLYTSDGTETGTKVVKAALVQPIPFATANNKLFFNAYSTVANGYELYASDGTTAGTKLVRDIYNGPASSNPYSLVNGTNLLYFIANNGNTGEELWVSDGLKTGTHQVKNITPGIDNSYLNGMVNANDRLFFTMNDTLWQSDATKEGTHKVQDATLAGVHNIYWLTNIGDWLYFTGYHPSIGQEVYTARVADFFAPDHIVTQQKTAAPVTVANTAFAVKLLNNPINAQLKLSINIQMPQVAQVTITDAGGRMIKTANQVLQTGTTLLSYEANGWAHGMYIIKVTMADGLSATIKAVK